MALQTMEIPESPRLFTTRYEGLGGVDYSRDMTEVDRTRTPTGTNMISDNGGNPVKRLGWRVINEISGAGKILKIVTKDGDDSRGNVYMMADLFVIAEHGVYYLHHRTDQTFETGYEVVTLYTTQEALTDCVVFVFNGAVYCILSRRIRYSTVSCGMYKIYENNAYMFENITATGKGYIPETTIGINYDGTGGTSLEAVNLLSPKMTFSFLGDGTNKKYYFYPANIRNDANRKHIIEGTLKVESLTTNGWVTLTKGTDYTVERDSTVTVNNYFDLLGSHTTTSLTLCLANITFTTVKPPLVAGQDNIRVTFEPFDTTNITVNGTTAMKGFFKERTPDLLSATSYGIYGHTKADRVFLVGGQNKNSVYYSQVDKPLYFPDNNFLQVGHDDNDILALQRVGDYLAVIKGDTVMDNTIYLIRGSYLDDNMYFMVIPTSATTGAIAPKGFATLVDEPLFFARTGVFAITNSYATQEKTIRNRSALLDRRLMKEPNLKDACAVTWNKYYVLCVNDHCYILDGRKATADEKKNSNYLYEAYYWEGIPAVTFATYQEELFFGTADGKICKLNTDVSDNTKYCDNGVESWNGTTLTLTEGADTVAIPCEWATPLDEDKSPQYFKNLNKKGNVVTLLVSEGTTAKVSLIKDGIKMTSLDTFTVPHFDWSSVDYSEDGIEANDEFIKKKIKKYKRLQIVIKNDGMFEPFGIIGITKTYTYGNFSK